MEINHLPLPPPPKLHDVIILFFYSFICLKFGRFLLLLLLFIPTISFFLPL